MNVPESPTAHDPFAELARSIEADEDEARWEERLRKIAQHKPDDAPPVPEKPE